MEWTFVNDGLPQPHVRVWVETDTGRRTTGYVKGDGEWFINCPRIRATGEIVVRWRE